MKTRRTKTVEVEPTDDGDWTFVARLTDEAWDGQFGGPTQVVIHDIEITGRLQGPGLTVVALHATPLELPYRTCPNVAPAVDVLIGAALRGPWRKTVLAHLGGNKGCTHLTTLLLGLAEVTTQVIFQQMNATTPFTRESKADGSWQDTGLDVEPGLVDVCYSLRRDSPVMVPLLRRRSAIANSTADEGLMEG